MVAGTDLTARRPSAREIEVRRVEIDVAVIGGGRVVWRPLPRRNVPGARSILDAAAGDEVVAIYAGPLIVVRTPAGMLHVHPHEIVVATGAAEIHPVCPGNELGGARYARAAQRVQALGVDLGTAVAIGLPPDGIPANSRGVPARPLRR